VVVDASLVVKWFFPEPQADVARVLLPQAGSFVAPDTMPIEVASALARRCRRREMQAADVVASIGDLRLLGIASTPSASLMADALEVSLANRHPFADCLYLALARRTGAALATFDRRLATLASHLSIPLWTPA
jgi:predicted nucleic acid-binding protein